MQIILLLLYENPLRYIDIGCRHITLHESLRSNNGMTGFDTLGAAEDYVKLTARNRLIKNRNLCQMSLKLVENFVLKYYGLTITDDSSVSKHKGFIILKCIPYS